MQALRLARTTTASLRQTANRTVNVSAVRSIAATANASASTSTATSSQASAIPLSNVEAQWENLTTEDQLTVHQQLSEIQKKDWRSLSLDEKKAAYYVAFGPHGPRKPVSPPGENLKVFFAVLAAAAAAGAISMTVRSFAPPPPKTLNKEWEEASNQRAIEMKLDPITGISSEGYQGKGFVQSK